MPNNKINGTDLHTKSEEINHIIGKMPSRFGKHTLYIIIMLINAVFSFGWLIKYPEVLKGEISINTQHGKVNLIANVAGKLQLYKTTTNADVKENDYIAVIKNSAETGDVKNLKYLLASFDIHHLDYKYRSFFPENLSLGELNSKYFIFLNCLYQYLDYYKEAPFEKQKNINKKLYTTQNQILTENESQYNRLKVKFEDATRLFERDSELNENNVLAKEDLEKSHIAMLSAEQEFRNVNKDITSNIYQIDDATNKFTVLNIQQTEKERDLKINLLNSFYDLEQSIKEWEHKYAFISTIDGKIEYLNFWKENDYVQPGQEIFALIPKEETVIGQVFLPEQGSGKVEVGQKVIIKLDNYPYTQYGSIKGNVQSISLVTNPQLLSTNQNKINSYLVTVNLPEGLKTNYGSNLNFRFESKGTAEIITKDRRLIERLFDNLFYRLNR